MDIVFNNRLAFLSDDQQVSHAFSKIWQQEGSAAATPSDTYHTVPVRCNCIPMDGSSAYLPFLHCHIFDLQKQDYMNYSVQVKVMPLKELLDPQGKAVMGGLQNLGIRSVRDVRIGKTIELEVEAGNQDEAKKIAEDASKKLLANPVMEYFE